MLFLGGYLLRKYVKQFLLNRINSKTLSNDHLSSFSSTNVQGYDEISIIPTPKYQQMTTFDYSAGLWPCDWLKDGHNIVQAFLDFPGFDSRNFLFNVVSIQFFSPLSILINLGLRGFHFPLFIYVSPN